MTSMDSHKHDVAARRRPTAGGGQDPAHPGIGERRPAQVLAADHTAHGEAGPSITAPADTSVAPQGARPPAAGTLGTPAVLDHQVVAVEIGTSACPVAIHRWTGEQVGTLLLTPSQAQVWARAGRLTLVGADGVEHRLTVLAAEEAAGAALGAHWPLGEPDGRAKRIAAAAAHDVGDLLPFPAWLARTAHLSGERNQQLARLVNRIRTASPETAVYYGQTFGHLHPRPDQHHPYDHRGLVGHEGWPGEL